MLKLPITIRKKSKEELAEQLLKNGDINRLRKQFRLMCTVVGAIVIVALIVFFAIPKDSILFKPDLIFMGATIITLIFSFYWMVNDQYKFAFKGLLVLILIVLLKNSLRLFV